jgi:hypothetical protein
MTDVTRAEHCVIACMYSLHDAGEILVSPFGVIPPIAARLAKLSGFASDIVPPTARRAPSTRMATSNRGSRSGSSSTCCRPDAGTSS